MESQTFYKDNNPVCSSHTFTTHVSNKDRWFLLFAAIMFYKIIMDTDLLLLGNMYIYVICISHIDYNLKSWKQLILVESIFFILKQGNKVQE